MTCGGGEMARDVEVERLLLQWARWRLGVGGRSGGLGYALSRPGVGQIARVREARIPLDACEAERTDRMVQELEIGLRRAVEVYYLHPGSIRTRAGLLGIGEAAMHQRIWRAHLKLMAKFSELMARATAERARVESLMRSK